MRPSANEPYLRAAREINAFLEPANERGDRRQMEAWRRARHGFFDFETLTSHSQSLRRPNCDAKHRHAAQLARSTTPRSGCCGVGTYFFSPLSNFCFHVALKNVDIGTAQALRESCQGGPGLARQRTGTGKLSGGPGLARQRTGTGTTGGGPWRGEATIEARGYPYKHKPDYPC